LATTRRSRLQLSRAWPPERGWGPVPQPGGQAGEVGEAAGENALGQALGCGFGQLRGDGADQALVARQAEDVIDGVGLAPRHQLLPSKAGIRAQQDLHPRPTRPDLADDAGYFIRGTGGLAAGLGTGPNPVAAAKRCLTA
jgi:hypothetical protein